MLKIQITMRSDSILDLMTVANALSLEAHGHGLDVVTINTDYSEYRSDVPWLMSFLILDDEAIEKDEEIKRQMSRVRSLARTAAQQAGKVETAEIDDLPF